MFVTDKQIAQAQAMSHTIRYGVFIPMPDEMTPEEEEDFIAIMCPPEDES